MCSKLSLSSQFSCLSLPRVGMTGTHHKAWAYLHRHGTTLSWDPRSFSRSPTSSRSVLLGLHLFGAIPRDPHLFPLAIWSQFSIPLEN